MLHKTVKLGLATLMLTPISSAFAAPITWDSGAGGNDHWYEATLSTGIGWTDAKALADATGGYLVSITSQDEQDFIVDNLLTPNSTTELEGFAFWTGGFATNTDLNDLENNGAPADWAWDNGDAWGYDNFYSGADGNGLDTIVDGTVVPAIFNPAFFQAGYDTELASYVRVSAYEELGVVEGYWSDLRESGTQPTIEVDPITGNIVSPFTLTNRTGGFIIEYDTQPVDVPAPSTLLLLGAGLLGFFMRRPRDTV